MVRNNFAIHIGQKLFSKHGAKTGRTIISVRRFLNMERSGAKTGAGNIYPARLQVERNNFAIYIGQKLFAEHGEKVIQSKIIDKINKINQNIRTGGIYSPRRPITFLKTFYARTRTHFSLTHYSIALFPFALLAQIINVWRNGDANFQWASSFLTICGAIMLIPALLSGFASFRINFKNKIKGNLNLKLKIVFTPLLIIFAVLASVLSVNPKSVVNGPYTALLSIIFLIMIIMEINGKKLTFKDLDRNS